MLSLLISQGSFHVPGTVLGIGAKKTNNIRSLQSTGRKASYWCSCKTCDNSYNRHKHVGYQIPLKGLCVKLRMI